jgi:hypothetical protein
MIDMFKRHEIQVLRRAGHPLDEVAKLSGVSRRSVVRVEAETAVGHVNNEAERILRGIGRPSKAEPFRPFVVELLAKEPALITLEILRRARLQGYAGARRRCTVWSNRSGPSLSASSRGLKVCRGSFPSTTSAKWT